MNQAARFLLATCVLGAGFAAVAQRTNNRAVPEARGTPNLRRGLGKILARENA